MDITYWNRLHISGNFDCCQHSAIIHCAEINMHVCPCPQVFAQVEMPNMWFLGQENVPFGDTDYRDVLGKVLLMYVSRSSEWRVLVSLDPCWPSILAFWLLFIRLIFFEKYLVLISILITLYSSRLFIFLNYGPRIALVWFQHFANYWDMFSGLLLRCKG